MNALARYLYDRYPHDHEAAEAEFDRLLASPTFRRAWHLYRLGFSLLPLDGKRPTRKWKRLQYDRCSIAELINWFYVNGWTPGIITGEVSGVVVVDCDDNDAIQTYHAEASTISGTTQNTRRGRHFVYRHPGHRIPNTHNTAPAIDRRGDGGYVVAYQDSEAWTQADISSLPSFDLTL